MYEAYVDDVGYRLVAIYTPIREDGVEGQPVSASTDPIAVGNLKNALLLLCDANFCLFSFLSIIYWQLLMIIFIIRTSD